MNNRGFTLIELTAVIVLLVAIFLVSFPTFLGTAKLDKQKQYDTMVENLCLAGESYIYSNREKFSELSVVGSNINIEISVLINEDLVEKGIINIKSKRVIDYDSMTFRVNVDYTLDCKYND